MSGTAPIGHAKAGVIGWPIAHSRSPLIHNHWFDGAQIDRQILYPNDFHVSLF